MFVAGVPVVGTFGMALIPSRELRNVERERERRQRGRDEMNEWLGRKRNIGQTKRSDDYFNEFLGK